MTRQSNIELLRIWAMFCIALHHFCFHGGVCAEVQNAAVLLNANIAAMSLTEAVTYIGVNCFILISGYCGIRFSARKVVGLYLMCAFYGLIGYFCNLVYYAQPFAAQEMLRASVFCFSKDYWWFINCYALLMLFAPFLNSGIKALSHRQFGWLIAGWSIAQIYFGYLTHTAYFDTGYGYNVLNFVYIYLIGAYLRRYVSRETVRARRRTWLIVYVTGTLLWAGLTCWAHLQHLPWWRINAYNNPVLILNAVMLFMYAVSFEFHSERINWMASGVLGVYLLQDHWIKGETPVCYMLFKDMFGATALGGKYMAAIAASVILLVTVCVFDRLRVRLFRPLLKYIPDKTEE